MAIHIIIDGYNLIRQSSELSKLDGQDLQLGRDALVDRLAAYKKIKHHKITVVFDGAGDPALLPNRDQAKGIAMRFSQAGESADDVIRRMARREKERALVVSSDREVVVAAEAAGAATMDSPAFEDKLVMADYFSMKGGEDPEDRDGWRPTTRKKGPSHRLPKRKRKSRAKAEKL